MVRVAARRRREAVIPPAWAGVTSSSVDGFVTHRARWDVGGATTWVLIWRKRLTSVFSCVLSRTDAVYETLTMYERSFAAISERFFKREAWPAPRAISSLADDDKVFVLLYAELYYRHLYMTMTPSVDERKASWENYCALFGVALHGDVNMQLPNLWLYEMVDEFVYQFQSFHQYKVSPKRTAEEKSALDALDKQVWDQTSVVNFLQALVDKSDVKRVLERERAGEISFAKDEGYSIESSNVLRTLGYFALIGISRVHVLVGNYEGALASLDAIDLDKEGMFTKVSGAFVATSYHVGFAYLMCSRYTDAIRHFNESLQYIDRVKNGSTRPHALPLLMKKQEQMYALLAIISALVPGQQHLLDDGVALSLHQKYSDKISRMMNGEVSIYDELFSYACPKFVGSQEAYKTQLKAFLEIVAAHAVIPKLRSHLKMYATVKVAKLAAVMDVSESDLRASLTAFDKANTVKQWNGGASALDGDDVYCGDIRVTMEGDVIKVAEMKNRKSAKTFFEQTNKKLSMQLEELMAAKPLVVKPSAIVS